MNDKDNSGELRDELLSAEPVGKIGSEYDGEDVSDNRLHAVLSYAGILVLIPLFTAATRSEYARFHANQGVVLLLAEIAASILSAALWFIPDAGTVLGLAAGLPAFLFTVACIFTGTINAMRGKARALPVIGSFDILK